ncbi:hypothetical protein [Microbulbifer taiwanensis]|uniref:hypothetical protein n=1 Tax=Microbulbifer taiwanensis TaxID=986746 RepID=UPI0036095FF3
MGGTLTNADSTGAILDSIHRQAYIDTAVNDLDIHYRGSHWHSHMQLGSTDARGEPSAIAYIALPATAAWPSVSIATRSRRITWI